MRRLFGTAVVCLTLAIPMGAQAQGGMMGGASGMGSGASMGNGSAMGGTREAPPMSGVRAPTSMSNGEVRSVDAATGELTLRHGPLTNLDMPAMTMVFRVKDPAMLRQVKVGDKVRFVAERSGDDLVVIALQPARQ